MSKNPEITEKEGVFLEEKIKKPNGEIKITLY